MVRTLFVFATLAPVQENAAGVRVSGRVVDGGTGKPIGGAVVYLWQGETDRTSGRQVFAGADGAFEFLNVPDGAYHVAPAIAEPRFSYRTDPVDIQVGSRDIRGLGLVITPAGPPLITVSGRLLMQGPASVPSSVTGIRTAGQSASVKPDGSFQLRLRSGERYRFTIDGLPAGYYIASVDAGSWDLSTETLIFRETPPAALQMTLAVGARRIRGRVQDARGASGGAQTTLKLEGPAPSSSARSVALSADGAFEVSGLRPGEYTLKAQRGSGNALQVGSSAVVVGPQDVSGIAVVLRARSTQRGRLLMGGAGRIEDLARFQPVIEVTDPLGVRQEPVRANGTFEFQSFEGEFSIAVKNLPPTYTHSISYGPGAVDVRIDVIQGDFPFLDRGLPRRLK